MKLLADECCDAPVVNALREDGHDVRFVIESDQGASDTEVLRRGFEQRRLLLTEDKDFGELVYRLQRPAYGVILLRFSVNERKRKIPRLRWLLEQQRHRLEGAFVTLEADKVRFRALEGRP